jgi:hypothetical protein
MKKEIALVAAVILFGLAYGLDYIAGPVSIRVKDPVEFFSNPVISKYPLTAVAVSIRSIAILTSLVLILSLIEKKYLLKVFISLFIGGIFELYAIQQIATGGRTTPIQWTLAFSYAGFLLLPAIIFYIIKGIITGIKDKLGVKDEKTYPQPIFEDKEKDKE